LKIKRILVSQPKPENDKSPYFDLSKKINAKVDFLQFTEIQGVSLKDFRKSRVNLPDYNAVIFTGKTGMDHYFRLCEETKFNVPETTKYYCMTEEISFYLQKFVQYRKRKIFFGKNKFEDLTPLITKYKTDTYLLPCSSENNKVEILKKLKSLKVNFCKSVMYDTVSSDLKIINPADYDIIVFYSPASVKALLDNFPDFKQGELKIATFGTITAKAVKDAGLRLDIPAPTVKAPSMTMAIEQYLDKSGKPEAPVQTATTTTTPKTKKAETEKKSK